MPTLLRLWVAVCLGCTTAAESPVDPPVDSGAPVRTDLPLNQLVLIADDLGVDKLSIYDTPIEGEQALTPAIDGLAQDGLVFDRGYAAPSCSPSRAALLTGDYPRKNGISTALKVGDGSPLDTDLPLLSRVLSDEAGYTLAWFGKWHLASQPDACDHPIQAGFDVYQGSVFNFTEPGSFVVAPSYERWEKCVDGQPELVEVYATEDTVADALEAIDSLPEPWVIVVSFNAPHEPFHRPPEGWHRRDGFDGTTHTLFLAAIESVDIGTERLLEALDGSLDARTNVWFVGDNGTPDKLLRLPPKNGKGSLRESGIRVPFVVRGPSVAEPGRRVGEFVHLMDLLPTFLGQAGVALPEGIGGLDLGPLLASDGTPFERDAMLWETFGPDGALDGRTRWNRSYSDGVHKLIDRQEWGAPRELKFFELERDDGWDMRDVLEGPGLDDAQQETFDRILAELDERLPVTLVETPNPL